jgi:hypothetical protein
MRVLLPSLPAGRHWVCTLKSNRRVELVEAAAECQIQIDPVLEMLSAGGDELTLRLKRKTL